MKSLGEHAPVGGLHRPAAAMATAADLVIAEVDEIVPVGALDPEAIVTPHLFVDHLVLSQL